MPDAGVASADDIRSALSATMPTMYRNAVPAYGTPMERVAAAYRDAQWNSRATAPAGDNGFADRTSKPRR